jgi:DNA-binding CsgD family transcriptional regulator
MCSLGKEMHFDKVFSALNNKCMQVARRAEGVAFLKTARELYQVERITYFCLDIPAASRRGVYSHCAYSDTAALSCLSHFPLGPELVESDDNPPHPEKCAGLPHGTVNIPLPTHAKESAAFEIMPGRNASDENPQTPALSREFRILASYFHSHVLRMNGYDVERDMLVSARELDCLRWTAAGKTAWEASVILGISERTVRFHLNAAREKLNCATTTQAVAKAIVNQLIDV